MITSKIIEIYNNPRKDHVFEVQIDAGDGAIEAVFIFDEFGDKWTEVNIESLSISSLHFIESKIQDYLLEQNEPADDDFADDWERIG